MTKKTLRFNTGRQYAPEGQIIEAELLRIEACPILGDDVYAVRFNDVTRGIRGEVQVSDFTQSAIMRQYDAGRYELI